MVPVPFLLLFHFSTHSEKKNRQVSVCQQAGGSCHCLKTFVRCILHTMAPLVKQEFTHCYTLCPPFLPSLILPSSSIASVPNYSEPFLLPLLSRFLLYLPSSLPPPAVGCSQKTNGEVIPRPNLPRSTPSPIFTRA